MLTNMLWKAAQANPTKPALVQGELRISYAQLARLSGCASEGLRHLGIQTADCVAVILPNCPEFVISLFACARLGAVMLPLNPHYTKDELQRFLVDGQAKVIITDPARVELCQHIIAETGQAITLIIVGDAVANTVRLIHYSTTSNRLNPLQSLADGHFTCIPPAQPVPTSACVAPRKTCITKHSILSTPLVSLLMTRFFAPCRCTIPTVLGTAYWMRCMQALPWFY